MLLYHDSHGQVVGKKDAEPFPPMSQHVMHADMHPDLLHATGFCSSHSLTCSQWGSSTGIDSTNFICMAMTADNFGPQRIHGASLWMTTKMQGITCLAAARRCIRSVSSPSRPSVSSWLKLDTWLNSCSSRCCVARFTCSLMASSCQCTSM